MTTNSPATAHYNTVGLAYQYTNASNSTTDPDHHHIAVIERNCKVGWPIWICIFANICGLISTALWFMVLLPQVWKNYRRKSVTGLSVLWATANFTASLVNIFFVFMYVSLPLYRQISSVYLPLLEFILLIQFWIYGQEYTRWNKVVYLCLCVIVWAAVITTQVISNGVALLWFAIFLWCVETFPQVLLNMRLKTTSGQATLSVLIAMLGKTTDIFSTYMLVMPVQYVVMAYFSSSVAYVNGLQVSWYYHSNDADNSRHSDDVIAESVSSLSVASSQSPVDDSRNLNRTADLVQTGTGRQHTNMTCVDLVRVLGAGVLCLLMAVCVAGLIWHIGALYGSLGPCCIVLVLGAGYLWFNYRSLKSDRVKSCRRRQKK